MLYGKSLKYILNCLLNISVVVLITSCADPSMPESNNKGIPVTVMKAEIKTIESISQITGIIKPKQLAYVTTAIPGKVKSTFYNIGDYVEEGDLLFTVDSTEIEDSISLLEEQLKVAEANLSMAKTGVAAAMGSSFESRKIQLEAALKSAENNFTVAKDAFDCSTLLFELKQINRLQYNQVKNQYQQANNALESAIKAYDLYISKISPDERAAANDQLKQAQASCDILRQQIENTRKKLTYTKITAPITGWIITKDIVEDCLISSSMIPYAIMNNDLVQASIGVTEKVVNKIKKGDELKIIIPSVKDEPFTGIVNTVSPAADQKTLAYTVLIDIPNMNGIIKPGMTIKAGVMTERHNEALILPISSVITDEAGSFVYAVEDAHAVKKTIDTGITSGDSVEILGGIDKSDFIVVKGQQFLKANDRVVVSGEVFE